MPHLLDESALEQQAPLSGRSSSRGSSAFHDIDYDAIVAGDLVGFRMANSEENYNTKGDPSMVVAIVLTDEEVVVADERRMEADPATSLPVWIVSPTFCGDSSSLFRYVNEDEMFVVDRPIDVNSIVVHRDTLQMGVVCGSNVDFHGLVLSNVFNYHRTQRFSGEQNLLASVLSAKVKQRPVCTQPWFRTLALHQRGVAAHCRRRSGAGRYFVRANPFYAGQLVRSKAACVDPPRADEGGYVAAGTTATPHDIVPSSRDGDDAPPSTAPKAPSKVHFYGHISSVTFTALVELFLPSIPGEESSGTAQGHTSLEYVVLIQPSIIESSMEENVDRRKVLFRHVRNVIQAAEHRFYHNDEGEHPPEDPTVAPSHVDAVSPLMYAEYIALETLQNDVQWVRGSCDAYIAELTRRQASFRRPRHHQQLPRPKSNSRNKSSASSTEPQQQHCTSESSLYGNGIVLFGFPELITALDADSGLPMDFTAGEIIPVETCGNDNVIVGQHGFAFDAQDPLFAEAMEAYAEHSATAGPCPSLAPSSERCDDQGQTPTNNAFTGDAAPTLLAAPSVPVMLATNQLYQWYQDHGILPADAGDSDWSSRLSHLYPVLDQLVLITHSFSTLTVRWRETGEVSQLSSAMLQLVPERSEELVRDLFPLDIVVPSDYYESDKHLDTLGPITARPTEQARVVLHDAACPILDVRCVYDYGTDLQVGESVQIRRLNERFVVEGEELPQDPTFLGIVSSVNVHDETCAVTWARQPVVDVEGVRASRLGDVGQIVELLSNTLVRVLWSAGELQDLPRAMLSPLRGAPDGDEEDEEGTELDEGDDGGNSSWTNGADDDVAERLADASTAPEAPADSRAAALGPWFNRLRDGLSRLASRLRDTEAAPPSPHRVPATPTDHAPQTDDGAAIDGAAESPSEQASSPHSTFEGVSMFTAHLHMSEDAPPVNPTIFQKRVRREWNDVRARVEAYCAAAATASNAVPPIFVKACTYAPRLLKFVLVGPLHTPYYQSFLAFDLMYGPQFPISPPHVRFHSYHLRLNPNLYEDGHICLSLLGTWEGIAQSESWSPAASSVMQIILSIQSLVLVKEPYYNEAGYEDQRGSASARLASKAYNENVALLRIRHLIAMAESPPPDWVFAFRRHFLDVAPQLQQRMTKLLEEQSADSPAASTGITADGLVLPLTKGFMQAMKRCLAELQKCHDRLKAQWAQEEMEVSLPHMT